MKTPLIRAILVCGSVLALAGNSHAATFVWNVASPGANNWNVNANWTPNTGNPATADTAIFGPTGTAANATTVNNVVSLNTTITALNYTNFTSGTWHVTRIPAGVTLTVSGATTVQTASTANGVIVDGSLATSVAMVDAGTWIANGNLTIGDQGTNAVPPNSTLDLSGLSNFVYSAVAGTISVGSGNRSAANMNFAAVSNNVTAGTVIFNTLSTSSSGSGTVRLGSGTNVFNVNTWNISAGRLNSTVNFLTSSGGLRIRGTNGNADDNSRVATMVVGNRNTGGSGGTSTGTLSFNGHPVDIKLGLLTMGQCNQNSGVAVTPVVGVGNLLFDNGVVDVTNINMAVVTTGSTNGATGNLTVGTNATLIFGRLSFATNGSTGNSTVSTGSVTNRGTIVLNGNAVKTTAANSAANFICEGGTINLQTNQIGTASIPIDNVSLSNTTVHVRLDGNITFTNITAATLTLNGFSTIQVDSLTNGPSVTGVPKIFPVFKYVTAENGSAGANFALPILPPGYIGVMADFNTGGTNQVVLEVFTNLPTGRTVIWDGGDGNWDYATANWKTNGVSTAFSVLDAVLFNDALTGTPSVNLTTVEVPSVTTVSNTVTSVYTFGGSGKISGTGGLTKRGTGTLVVDNGGINDFTGGVLVSAGTVQIGNNDNAGNLPAVAGITNNGALVYNRSDNITVANVISGSGSLTKIGNGTLTLTGTDTYGGRTEVDSGTFILSGTLSGGGLLTNATGTTLIVSGTNAGPVVVSGALLPGGSNAPATMGAGGLSLFPGATVTYDLNAAATPGSGVNDLIEVAGGLTLNGNTLSVNLLGSPTVGAPYRLIDYSGVKSGSFNSTVPVNSHLTATLDQTTPNQINLTFGGSPGFLKWNSGGDANWDIGTTANWSNAVTSVSPDVFYQVDSVYFNDEPGVVTTISIPAGVNVAPTVISNNSTAGVNEFTISGPGRITGGSSVVKNGTSALTFGSANSFTGLITINAGTVKGTAASALGSGPITVNSGATVVFGGMNTNAVTLVNGTLGTINVDCTNRDLTISAGTTNLLLSEDAQTTTTSRNIMVDGPVHGSGVIVVKNADGITGVDTGQGVRFRTTNTLGNFSGTIIYTNNTKGELQVAGFGPFSPINTGKLVVYAGTYNGDGTTGAPDGISGYSELNIRNNAPGDSVISNDVEIAGTGAAVINSLGSSPNNAVATMGNLKIGTGQELIGYKAASGTTNTVKFSSVTLTGGNATFSPKSSTFGVATEAGTFLILNNITDASSGSGIIMNGLSTLTLSGTSTYTGPTAVQQGKLLLNGFVNGGGNLTGSASSVVAGNGTNSGVVDVSGVLIPGDQGTVGAFGAGTLTLEGGAMAAFDLSGTNTANSGVNDLIQVGSGGLTVNGNIISNNVNQSTMQTGNYRLINYGGLLTVNSPMSPILTLNGAASRYTAALDTSVSGQVNLNIGGGPVTVVWDSTGSTTWDQGLGSTPNWSNTVSLASSDVFYTADTVLLSDIPSVVTNLILSGISVFPTAITNNSATNYAITGDGKISGAAVVVKDGSSTLFLATSNNYTGPTVIRGGGLKISNATNGSSSLGALPGGLVTITNGSTLDVGGNPSANGLNFGSKPFIVGGAGVGGNGVIVNSGAVNQQNTFQLITLTNNATFGGTARWDLRGGSPNPVLDLAGFKLTKTGPNQISLVGPLVTSGDIDINQGVLSFETTSTVTNSGTITVNPGGSLGHFRQNANLFTRPVVLNGGTITNLSGGGSTNDSPISIVADSTVSGLSGNDLYLRGPITGAFGLTKINSNSVILAGTNSYTGNTVVSGGTLMVTNAPLTNSLSIVIGTNATLNLGGIALPLLANHSITNDGSISNSTSITAGAGSTLTGGGFVTGSVTITANGTISGNLNVQNNITVQSGGTVAPGTNAIATGKLTASVTVQLHGTTVMKIDKSNPVATNDAIACTIGTTILDGLLRVTNVGPSLVAGDAFQLLTSAGGFSGAFTNVTLPTLDPGLGWNTNVLNSSGLLSVVSVGPVNPTTNAAITKVTLSGTNVLVHGTNNNVPNTNFHYVVLTTLNLTNALSNWTPVVTNPFNADGTFDYTNPIVPGTPRQFIDVKAVP